MLETKRQTSFVAHVIATAGVLVIAAGGTPRVAKSEIIWSGDFDNGCPWTQWHAASDSDAPQFSGIPAYGRPVIPNSNCTSRDPSYFGNGELLQLVTAPIRQGTHAAKFTVKNSVSGREPEDCDVGGNCSPRRTELWMHTQFPQAYGAMQQYKEYWISTSYYVPEDWDDGGSSWGPLVFQIKPSKQVGSVSPTFNIALSRGTWSIRHTWSPDTDPGGGLPWQYAMSYRSSGTESALMSDFPDSAKSRAALADVNKGGWTDWVINVRWDHRGANEGGSGHLDVWKRAGSEAWIHIVSVRPKEVTIGGLAFDRGIGYDASRGFGPIAGLYMDKGQVWGLSDNRVIYVDNVRIGSSSAAFSDMSPDGSSPGSQGTEKDARPLPPRLSLTESEQ